MNFEQLIAQFEYYPVLFIGDHHGSDSVHNFLALLIKDLHRKGYKLSIANEWFTPEDNRLLARYSTSEISDNNFTKSVRWKKRIGYDFESYAPIYQAVQEVNATLYGINMSKTERKKISDLNLSAMQASTLSLYEKLDTNISAHKQMLSPFFSHCHAPKHGESDLQCIERMYRVQVAWDTVMGENSAALAKNVLKSRKDKLIVFVGAFHLAYDLGANLRFARHSTLPYITLLPLLNSEDKIEVGESDYLFLYEPEKEEVKELKNSSES